MKKKTLWEKIYSALGFWKYDHITYDDHYRPIRRRIYYWCCFPYGKFYRKFNLFSIKVKE